MHIGLIGGIGPAATDFYYRGLIDRLRETGHELDATIAHCDNRVLATNLLAGDQAAQAAIYLDRLERLKRAGAEVAAITSVGGHFCIEATEPHSPLPLVNIVPVMDAYLKEQGLKKVGLLGTKVAMAGKFYGGLSTVEVAVLDESRLDEVSKNYLDMAGAARVTDAQCDIFYEAARTFHSVYGVDATLLAGTDLFLAFHGVDLGFPIIDCAEVHMDALADLARRSAE